MIRVRIVSLFACLLCTDCSVVTDVFLKMRISNRVLQMLLRYPWNSALHQACVVFFRACFQSKKSMVWRRVIQEDGFVELVTQAVWNAENTRHSETLNYVGYSGSMIQMCQILQTIEEENQELHDVLLKQSCWSAFKGTLEEMKKRQNAFVHVVESCVCCERYCML